MMSLFRKPTKVTPEGMPAQSGASNRLSVSVEYFHSACVFVIWKELLIPAALWSLSWSAHAGVCEHRDVFNFSHVDQEVISH